MPQSLNGLLKAWSRSTLPSIRSLARDTKRSRRSVQEELNRLSNRGELIHTPDGLYAPDEPDAVPSQSALELSETFNSLSDYEDHAICDFRGGLGVGAWNKDPALRRSRSPDPIGALAKIIQEYHDNWSTNTEAQRTFAFRNKHLFELAIQAMYLDPSDAVLFCGMHAPQTLQQPKAAGQPILSMPALSSKAFDLEELKWTLREHRPKLIYISGSCYYTGRIAKNDIVDATAEILLDYRHGWAIEGTASPTDREAAEASLVCRMRGRLIYSHDFSKTVLPLILATVPVSVGELLSNQVWGRTNSLTKEEAGKLLPYVEKLKDGDLPAMKRIDTDVVPLAREELEGMYGYLSRTNAVLLCQRGMDVKLAEAGVLTDRGGLFSSIDEEWSSVVLSFFHCPADLEKVRQGLRIVSAFLRAMPFPETNSEGLFTNPLSRKYYSSPEGVPKIG